MDNECLDESWVEQFKADERPYEIFYKEQVISVEVICIYVDSNRNVVFVSKEKHQLLDDDSVLLKEELSDIIKTNERRNGMKYSVESIAKYNFSIEPDEVISMDSIDARRYFHSEKYVSNIYFEGTIALLQDANAVFIIFVDPNTRGRLTRHVRPHKPVRYTRRRKK